MALLLLILIVMGNVVTNATAASDNRESTPAADGLFASFETSCGSLPPGATQNIEMFPSFDEDCSYSSDTLIQGAENGFTSVGNCLSSSIPDCTADVVSQDAEFNSDESIVCDEDDTTHGGTGN